MEGQCQSLVADNKSLKIGFLGAGNMAQALSKGFISAGLVTAENVIASISDTKKDTPRVIKDYGVEVTEDNRKVVQQSDVVIIAVKPHIVPIVLSEVKQDVRARHLFVSIASGVTIETMTKLLSESTRIIRTMPNTPSLVQSGATVYTPGKMATEADCELVERLFTSVGICERLPEHLIDCVCGLSGSGPAYCFVAMEALSDGGVKMGLPRAIANKFAAQTLLGSAKLVLETGKHPGQLKDAVCSPGGTTITALHALEKQGFRAALMDAVEVSTNRARELGKQ